MQLAEGEDESDDLLLILNLCKLQEEKTCMRIGNREFDTKNETYIMGILNVTPDSFSDGGIQSYGCCSRSRRADDPGRR